MTSSTPSPDLIADIGGTNARFALVDTPGGQTRDLRVIPTTDHANLVDAVNAYLAGSDGPRPQRAVLAIANPITGDQVKMTNHHWSFSIEATRVALSFTHLRLINDFTALALSLPLLGAADLHAAGGGTPVADAAKGLIGPGTGLGVSGLVRGSHGWVPLEGEGGHASFAPVDELEIEILRWALARHPHVSIERLVSGGLGLPNLYQALAAIGNVTPEPLSSAEISARGLAGTCPLCAQALEVFCAMLGTAAGNLAVTLGARGGVYIGGGIVPRFLDFFAQSRFRARFEHRGRFSDYLRAIPCYVITTGDAALRGASAALGDWPAQA